MKNQIISSDVSVEKTIESLISFSELSDHLLDGQMHSLKGNRMTVHLMSIHNCKNLVIKNLNFEGGDTSVLKKFKRSELNFRKDMLIFEKLDGAAALITGNSNVAFENCTFKNNNSILCAGAVSNQSEGLITFKNCLFENNSAGHTGAAIDNLTPKSQIIVENCKFINNKSNTWYKNGSPHGQISLFPETSAKITNCSFSGGSIPFDYYPSSSIILEGNTYENYADWDENVIQKRNFLVINYLKLFSKLYWVVPKTFGKVRYIVKRGGVRR